MHAMEEELKDLTNIGTEQSTTISDTEETRNQLLKKWKSHSRSPHHVSKAIHTTTFNLFLPYVEGRPQKEVAPCMLPTELV